MAHDQLLNIAQAIPENLGSNQIISTLDYFLYKALAGILAFAPSFIDCRVANLMHAMGRDETRRAYSIDHSNIVTHSRLMEYFCEGTDKLNQIKLAALDRIFIVDWIDKYLKIVRKMVAPMPASLNAGDTVEIPSQCYAAALSIDLPPSATRQARAMLANVEPYFETAMEFRGWIMQKYYRYIYGHVLGMVRSTKMAVDQNDLYQNTLLVSVNTINKYSSNKGTLTEFIALWLRSAYALKFDHNVGQSYSLPVGKRSKMGESEWIDKGVARSNLAFDLNDALHIQADIDGQPSDNDAETSREQDAFIIEIVNACSNHPLVRQFAVYGSIIHSMNPPLMTPDEIKDKLNQIVANLESVPVDPPDIKNYLAQIVEDLPVIELDDGAEDFHITFSDGSSVRNSANIYPGTMIYDGPMPTHEHVSLRVDYSMRLESIIPDQGSEYAMSNKASEYAANLDRAIRERVFPVNRRERKIEIELPALNTKMDSVPVAPKVKRSDRRLISVRRRK